jgi:hypothetical protein
MEFRSGRYTDLQTVSQLCATFNHSLQKNDFGQVEVRLETPPDAPHEAALLRLDISRCASAWTGSRRWSSTRRWS